MRGVRIAFIATLLAAGTVTGTAAVTGTTATAMEPSDGAICGAWEPTGGTSFHRLCIDGNRYWYEYR